MSKFSTTSAPPILFGVLFSVLIVLCFLYIATAPKDIGHRCPDGALCQAAGDKTYVCQDCDVLHRMNGE